MIQKPPIDVLVEKAGSKYALACGVAKRARQIIDQPHTATECSQKHKPLSAAAYEVYEGRLKFSDD